MRLKANSRLYRYLEDDSIEEVRIIRVQNEEVCTIRTIKGNDIGKEKKITEKELLDSYTLLNPIGYVTFNIVKVNVIEDIMITIIRDKDKHEGAYVICRQCASDLFAKQLSPDHVDYVGISVSKESCPANVNFNDFFVCDEIIRSEVIAYYLGDKLEDITRCVKNMKKFNSVLMDLFIRHCNYLANNNKLIAATYEKKEEVDGYCKTLEQLLDMNNFKYDLCRAFDIVPTTFSRSCFESSILENNVREFLSSVLMRNVTKTLCVEYDGDVDLSEIKRDYCLISDKDDTVWVVAYIYEGKYIVDLSNESAENISKLNKMYQSESVQLAYNHIKFKDDKYKK